MLYGPETSHNGTGRVKVVKGYFLWEDAETDLIKDG